MAIEAINGLTTNNFFQQNEKSKKTVAYMGIPTNLIPNLLNGSQQQQSPTASAIQADSGLSKYA